MGGQHLAELIELLGGEQRGSGNPVVAQVASLASANTADLAFFEGDTPNACLSDCRAGVVIVRASCAEAVANTAWVVDEPRLIFARAAEALEATNAANTKPRDFIAPNAVVAPDAVIGKNVYIAEGTYIGNNVRLADGCQIYQQVVIGDNCQVQADTIIYPRAVLYPKTVVGKKVIIHAGVVIGADGFGFVATATGGQQKIPHFGKVEIGDNVEIGANTTIDRGTLDNTLIGNGVKIDNLVQIGHNVRVGANTIICGCVGIAGSTTIGKNCLIGGASCLIGHITIGDNAQVAGATNVVRDVEAGAKISSQMAPMPIREWQRLTVMFKKMVSNKNR